MLPYLFDRIHFRGVGWNGKQLYILRQDDRIGPVPGSSVTNKQNGIFRIPFRQVVEEDVHALCVAIRQYQKESFARGWLHRPVCVSIFPYMVAGYRRSYTLCTPTPLGLVDPPESCLVLKHQPYCACLSLLLALIQHPLLNFFEALTASSSAAFGCFDRGDTFLHPFLFSTLYT